jgi:hypothetical protein
MDFIGFKREKLNTELEKGRITKEEFEKLDHKLKHAVESKHKIKRGIRTSLALIGIKTILPF